MIRCFLCSVLLYSVLLCCSMLSCGRFGYDQVMPCYGALLYGMLGHFMYMI